jgi:ELWxxDGT repeat protein
MTGFATTVCFSAYTLETGRELWKYDGTNIFLAADINNTTHDLGGGIIEGNSSNPDWLTLFNGKLYFSAFDLRRGAELWSYDGSIATRVADINPDANDTITSRPKNSWPSELTVFDNALYFSANSGSTVDNYELWKLDGVNATQAANIHPDSGPDFSSYPKGLTIFQNSLYFMADDGAHGFELWKHDGNNTILLDINPGGPESSSFPKNFVEFNNELYFQAYTPDTGFELWKTDGSKVSLAADLNPGASDSFPANPVVYNGALYFSAADKAHGHELWKYDANGAQLVADINPSGDSFAKNLVVFKNLLCFTADDGVHGWELWKYDGTNASIVADLNTSGDSFPSEPMVINDILYFIATTPDSGYEIWKFGGTSVFLATDINPGGGDSFPRHLTNINGQLYFSATDDGISNWELWTLCSPNIADRPKITGIHENSGSVTITVSGSSGIPETLQGSVDLTAWDVIETKTPVSGSVTFTDLTNLPQRFYRVIIQ